MIATLYINNTHPDCEATAEFLQAKDIKFITINISTVEKPTQHNEILAGVEIPALFAGPELIAGGLLKIKEYFKGL
jgi:glutaredoxin